MEWGSASLNFGPKFPPSHREFTPNSFQIPRECASTPLLIRFGLPRGHVRILLEQFGYAP